MPKYQITLHIDSEVLRTSEQLKNQILVDEDLVFFINHTSSKQNWYRYVFQMGVVKIKQDMDRWKNEIQDKS